MGRGEALKEVKGKWSMYGTDALGEEGCERLQGLPKDGKYENVVRIAGGIGLQEGPSRVLRDREWSRACTYTRVD